MSSSTDEPDWEITPEGLYMATRHFLLRRGYCCTNQCRNCPYINWRENPEWLHAPAEAIQGIPASPKALVAIYTRLAIHKQALTIAKADEQARHRELIAHYRTLLERWQ